MAAHPFHCRLVTIGVSASFAQPSHSLRPAATSTGVPSACPSRCLHLVAFNTGVPLACPSHCYTLRPSIREFHQHALLVAFILRPSIRESHQHALLTGSPCGLQYGSSISTPFSLPLPRSLQRTLGTPTPSLAVAYGHDACISRLKQLVRCLSHSQKRRMYISSMCRTWSLLNIGLSIDPLPQGRTPHFHTFYCFACTIYAILLTRPKP